MQLQRPAFALDPRFFGRGPQRDFGNAGIHRSRVSDDVRLFATTFVAGFLFVSILIG